MDLFGPEDDWQSSCGWVSLIKAEYRLRKLRRMTGPVLGLHAELMLELREQRAEYLAAVHMDPEVSD